VPNRLGLTFAILAIIAALSAADLFLARTESAEVRGAARRDCEAGAGLLGQGKAAEAASVLEKAHAMDRGNSSCALELAEALMQSGKREEARALLNSELERAPNDAEANLLQARLAVLEGKFAEAQPYYHRAIYGTWTTQPGRGRLAARLELAEFLALHGSAEELLAELLPLEAEASSDIAVRKQVAHLYLAANSPTRAETVYRALIRDNPRDLNNFRGLGETELALGNYGAGRAAFEKAGATDRAALAAELIEMDPTPRGLSTAGKFSRSVAVLQLVRDAAVRCSPELAKDADEIPAKKARGEAVNELAEERLSLAEHLWQARQQNCGPGTSADEEAIRLIMGKLTRR
jgi:thioredoxin-like negative regulator of GroEL